MNEQTTNAEQQEMTCKPAIAKATPKSNCVEETKRVCTLGADDSSYVYLLAHRTANLVKIGKANSIISRATNLGLTDFDLSNSIGLQVTTEREAFEIERLLHTVFKAYRAPLDKVSEFLTHSSGMTEWFNADCMSRVQELLNHIQDIVPFKQVAISIPSKQEKPDRIRLTNEEKKLRQQKAFEEANRLNAQSAVLFEQSFKNLRSLVKFIGVTTPSNEMFYVHFTFADADLEKVSYETHDMFASANFKTLGGSTSLIGSLVSHFENESDTWLAKISVYRPYHKVLEDSCAETIERLYQPFLDFLRSILLINK